MYESMEGSWRRLQISSRRGAWAMWAGVDLTERPNWLFMGWFNRCDHKLVMVELGHRFKVW